MAEVNAKCSDIFTQRSVKRIYSWSVTSNLDEESVTGGSDEVYISLRYT